MFPTDRPDRKRADVGLSQVRRGRESSSYGHFYTADTVGGEEGIR